MKKKILLISLAFLLVVSMVNYADPAQAAAPTKGKVYQWTFMSTIVSSSESFVVFKNFCQAVKERSGGQFVIRALATGEHPYKGSDILDAVRDGLTQIGETEDIYITGKEPALCPYTIPLDNPV